MPLAMALPSIVAFNESSSSTPPANFVKFVVPPLFPLSWRLSLRWCPKSRLKAEPIRRVLLRLRPSLKDGRIRVVLLRVRKGKTSRIWMLSSWIEDESRSVWMVSVRAWVIGTHGIMSQNEVRCAHLGDFDVYVLAKGVGLSFVDAITVFGTSY